MATAILVAAGSGQRFGPDADKLFLEVAGCPVIAHTWTRFDRHPDIADVIVVARAGMEQAFHDIARGVAPTKPWKIVVGGRERQDSVWNGLEATREDCELVAVQDGARPCTSDDVISAVLAAARESGAAVAARRVTDTLKESADGRIIERTVDRSRLWAVQTPQAFFRGVLQRALAEARRLGLTVTDDTAACECVGQPVRLVETRGPNPKVTYPGDIPYIEWLLRRG
jgi:2-C-methyl-D-erythritol 4-phosphate cytidylyltransferase